MKSKCVSGCKLLLMSSVCLRQAACWSWTPVTPTRWFSRTPAQICGETSLLLQGKNIASLITSSALYIEAQMNLSKICVDISKVIHAFPLVSCHF